MAEYSKFDNEGKKITYRCEIPSPQYLSGDVAISDPLNYRQVNENFHTLEGMTLSGMKYDDGILWVKRADGKTASADIVGYSSGAQIVIDDVVCTLKDIMASGESVGQVVAPRSQEYGFNFVPSGSVSVLKGNDGEVVIYVPTGKITLEDGTEVSVNSADVYMNEFKVGTVFSPGRSDIAMRFSGENGIDVSQTGNTIVVSAKNGTVPGLPIGEDEIIIVRDFKVTADTGTSGGTAHVGKFVISSGESTDTTTGFRIFGSGGIETVTSGKTIIVNGNFGNITGKVSEQRIAVTDEQGNPEDVASYMTTDSKGVHFKDSLSVLPRRYDDTSQYTDLRFNSLLSSLKTGAVGKWRGIQVPYSGQVNRNVILEGDGIDIRYDISGDNDVFTFSCNSTGLPEYYKSDRLSISGNGNSSVNLGNIVYDTRDGNTISGFTISGTNGISVNCTGNTIQVSGKINAQEDYSEVGMRIGQANPSTAISEVCKFLATSGVGSSFVFRSTPSVFIEPETGQSTNKYTDVKYHALITSIGPEKNDSAHTIEFKDYDQNTGFPSPDSYDRHLKIIGRDGINVDINPSANTITLSGSGKSLYLLGKEGSPASGFSGSSYYIQPENGITARVESPGSDKTILHIGSNGTPPVEQRNVSFSGNGGMQSMSGNITIVAESGITGNVQYSESGSTLRIGSNGTPTPTEQRKFYYGERGRETEATGDIHFLAGEGIGISGSQAQSGTTLTLLAKPSSRAFVNDKGVILISSGDMKPLQISGGENISVSITTGGTANVISISFIPPVVEKEEGSSDGKITLSENTVPTISLNALSSEGKETLEKVVLSVPSSSETYSIVVNVDKSMSGRNLNELITSSGYTIDTWIDESGSERESITIPSSFERLTYFVTITNGMAIITRSVTSATARKTVL